MRNALSILLCAAAFLSAQQARRAPGWALTDSKLKLYDLADYRGKIVILEFMQTNCPHCSAVADTLNAVEQQYGPKIQIVAVVSAQTEKDYTVASYVQGHKVDYPILFDSGQMMYSYVRNPNIAFPHIYVIDSRGTIRFDYPYDVTTRDVFEGKGLNTAIDRLLAEQGGKK
jgi:peroxiredoxin